MQSIALARELNFHFLPTEPRKNHGLGYSHHISGGIMAIKRVLKINDVLHRCSISRLSLYRLISKGHFPSQLRLSPEGRSVGWLEEDIEGWISSRKPINDGTLK